MIQWPASIAVLPALFVLLGDAPSARGQYAPGMDGRALDANNQVGAGGINAPAPRPFFNAGNLYVTGNVTAGRSFRGFAPIRDSSSLLLTLPSSPFHSFQQGTTGLDNVLRGDSPGVANPFFNPALTVSRVSDIVARRNAPGSSVPRYTFLVPQVIPRDERVGSPLDVGLGGRPPESAAPNSSIYTPGNLPLLRELGSYDHMRLTSQADALRRSGVFGQSVSYTRSISPADAYRATTIEDPYALSTGVRRRRDADPFERRTRVLERADAAPSSEEMLAGARHLLSPTAIAPRLFQQPVPDSARDQLTGRPLPSPSPFLAAPEDKNLDPLAARDLPAHLAPVLTTPGSEPGAQVVFEAGPARFNPLLELAGAVQWLADVDQDAELRRQVSAVESLREQYERAVSLVRGASSKTVSTMAGGTSSTVDDLVARAEQKVREGNYYQASTLYRLAAATDPDNPLIRLGHAHALLAAGEYLTAVLHLTIAIDAYPAFAYLRLDLNAFIPDPNALDIRRADLERRLDLKEDYRLRFLLGYTEYYSGLRKFGLPNLRRAAEQAPAESVIARFPAILEAGTKPLGQHEQQIDKP